MKCLYFRPLFKYFEVLSVHSDMILFLMNEKSWMCYQTLCVICVMQAMVNVWAYQLMDSFNWHKCNYNMKTL